MRDRDLHPRPGDEAVARPRLDAEVGAAGVADGGDAAVEGAPQVARRPGRTGRRTACCRRRIEVGSPERSRGRGSRTARAARSGRCRRRARRRRGRGRSRGSARPRSAGQRRPPGCRCRRRFARRAGPSGSCAVPPWFPSQRKQPSPGRPGDGCCRVGRLTRLGRTYRVTGRCGPPRPRNCSRSPAGWPGCSARCPALAMIIDWSSTRYPVPDRAGRRGQPRRRSRRPRRRRDTACAAAWMLA